MHISLRQLRAFIAAVEAGSFTRAAHRLHLSQSAVSMVIRQLESEVGLALFNREAKRITLTVMGQQLVPIARRMLDDLERIAVSASDVRQLQRGSLRFSAPSLLACTLVPPALAAFSARHPQISVQIMDTSLEDIPAAVERGAVEFGIGPDRPTGPGVDRSFFRSIAIEFVCSSTHWAARKRSITWADARDDPWIYYPSTFEQDIREALWQHGRTERQEDATVVEHLPTALALVGHGLGVTTAPDYARALRRDLRLRFIPLVEPSIERAFYVYKRNGHPLSPAARAFLQAFE
ncbi:MAG: LysR family transcriptional regulator [Burkholderiaceae bacterium]|nr:LysR family transcriptional regulator [Rhodoferax sp.]